MQRVLLAATLMALWPALAVGQVPPTLAPVPPLPRIGLPLPEISGSEKPVAGRTDAQKPPSRKEAHRLPRPDGKLHGKHRRHGRPSSVVFFPVYVPYPLDGAMGAPPDPYTPARGSTITEEPPAPAEQTEQRDALAEQAEARANVEREQERNETAAGQAPERAPEPERPPEPPPPPSTFYYIPGCYMGNVPPDQVQLPSTCDRSKVVVRKP